MARRVTTVTEEKARQLATFDKWLKEARTVDLLCHVGGHEYTLLDPDLETEDVKLKRGVVQISTPCRREDEDDPGETCGTLVRKILGHGGVLEYSKPVYDYDHRYQIPPEALDNGWLSRAQRGQIRLELIERGKQRKARKAKLAKAQAGRKEALAAARAASKSGGKASHTAAKTTHRNAG